MEFFDEIIHEIDIGERTLVLGSKYNIKDLETNQLMSIQITEIGDEEIYFKDLKTDNPYYRDIEDIEFKDTIEIIETKNLYNNELYSMSSDLITGIVGRNDLDYYIKNEIDLSNTVLISITDPDRPKINKEIINAFNGALETSFWDVEESIGHYIPIDEKTSKIIKDFILDNKDKKFIIHCEAGVSRSAGVGMAIECLVEHNGEKYHYQTSYSNVKSHPRYFPNLKVYDMILS